MRPIHNDLIARLRTVAPTARDIVEAHAVTAADIRQRKDQWDAADSLTDLDTRVDGGVALTSTIATLIGSTTGTSFITDLSPTSPYTVPLITWGGTDDSQTEVQRIIARLHPKRTGAAKTVVWWRCRLFNLTSGVDADGAGHFVMVPLGDPVTVAATGEAEGDVTFDFSTQPSKPKPKSIIMRRDIDQRSTDLFIGTGDFSSNLAHTAIQITALRADGSAADNVGLVYDNTITEFGTGNVLRGWNFQDDQHPLYFGRWEDIGQFAGVPRVSVQTGTFTASATLTFSTTGGTPNVLDLGAAPTGSVYLMVLAETPPGTSVTAQVRNDADTDWVTYTDGQTFTELGLVATQTRKFRWTLNSNAAQSVTPILRRGGMEEKTIIDLSHVAEITDYECHFDPVNLEGRITRATLRGVKNGIADFRSTIEDLLSTYDVGTLEFRWYIGDTSLTRPRWTLIDAFPVVDDFEPRAADIGIELLGANALIAANLPKYDFGGSGTIVPDDDLDNTGAWEDQAGGSTDLFGFIDEEPADDTDYVISPDTPSNDQVTFRLSDIADPNRDTGHFMDVRYSKSAAGGDLIDLTLQLRQGYTNEGSQGTLISTGTLTNITDEWTDASFGLTEAQAQSISDYTDLAIRVVANTSSTVAARAARISWLRFRITGHRPDLEYANDPADEVYADLLEQAEMLDRHKGQGLTDTSEVTKTIRDSSAFKEANSLVANFGAAIVSSQGQIKTVTAYGSRGISAFFRSETITPVRTTPGLRERRPLVSVPWNYSEAASRFEDEVIWSSSPAQNKLGPSRTDARDYRWPVESSKWIYSETIAKGIAKRTGEALATGLILWKFRSRDPYPELEPGDVVAVETTRFVMKDPHSSRAIRGRQVALATLTDCSRHGGVWEYTAWVQGYLDILAPPEKTTRTFANRDAQFDNLYIALPIIPGTAAAVEPVTKTLRVHASQLVPILDNGHWNINTLWAQGRLANIDAFFVGPGVLPEGVTITAFRARAYLQNVTDTAVTSLLRAETDATTTLVTLTHATAGWNTDSSGVLSESVTAARNYTVFSQLKGVAAAADARLQWFEIDYTMPDYTKTV